MNLTSKKFGRIVRRRRVGLGVTIRGLRRRTGLAVSLIQLIERGRANPTLATIKKLARVMRVKFIIWP